MFGFLSRLFGGTKPKPQPAPPPPQQRVQPRVDARQLKQALSQGRISREQFINQFARATNSPIHKQGFVTKYSPGNVGMAALGAGRQVGEGIVRSAVNTGKTPIDAVKLVAAETTGNRPAIEKNTKALREHSLDSWISPVAKPAYRAAVNRASNKVLDNPRTSPEVKQAQINQVLEPAYNRASVSLKDRGNKKKVKDALTVLEAVASPLLAKGGVKIGGKTATKAAEIGNNVDNKATHAIAKQDREWKYWDQRVSYTQEQAARAPTAKARAQAKQAAIQMARNRNTRFEEIKQRMGPGGLGLSTKRVSLANADNALPEPGLPRTGTKASVPKVSASEGSVPNIDKTLGAFDKSVGQNYLSTVEKLPTQGAISITGTKAEKQQPGVQPQTSAILETAPQPIGKTVPKGLRLKSEPKARAGGIRVGTASKDNRIILDDLLQDKRLQNIRVASNTRADEGSYALPKSIRVSSRGGEKKVTVGKVTIPKELVGDANQWRDVGSTLKTMDRNIEKAAPTPEQYRKIYDFIIAPRGEAVTRMVDEIASYKTALKDVVAQTGMKKKSVRADVMKFGEKKISYENLVKKHGRVQADKIVAANKWFRQSYDKILSETNYELRRFSLPEIPRRENYYTHFSDPGIFSNFGLKVQQLARRGDVLQEADGLGSRTQKIDPKLLGQSEFTQPKKRFNPFAQRRKGDQTDYDAVKAFERYLLPTLHNKHLTESVVRTRIATKEFQKATEQSKNLPNLIRQLQEYGNDLAGKTNRFDRPFLETKGGKKLMDSSRYLQRQMGRNTILGSMSSAVMQVAALPQSIAQAGAKNTLLGLMQEFKGVTVKDNLLGQSPFLRRRYEDVGSVIPSKLEKGEQVAGLVFNAIEETSTKSIWRAQHALVQSKGLKGQAAVREADRLTERIVAGRQIGEKPEAFRSVMGNTVAQFQLEVGNFAQQVAQDFAKDPVKLAKLFAATYVFNLAYNEILGRKPLPDPVDAAIDVAKNVADSNFVTAVGRLPGEVLSNVPGGQVAAGLYPQYGVDIGGKKTPSRNELFGDTEAGRYGGSVAALGAIKNPEYAIPKTFALGQIERSAKGVGDYVRGKSTDKNGKTKFDIEQNKSNAARAGLFGTYATKSGKDYIKKKNDSAVGKTQPNEPTTSSDIAKAAFNSPQAKELMAIPENDRSQFVKDNPQFKGIYDQMKAFDRAFNNKPELPDGLSETSSRLLARHSGLTDNAREKQLYEKNDYEFSLKLAQFERDKLSGKLTKKEEFDRQGELYKSRVGSVFSKDARDLYSMSRERIEQFAMQNGIPMEIYKQMLALDKAEVEAGLRKYHKLAGGGSGGRSGGKGGRTAKKKNPRIARVSTPSSIKLPKPKAKKFKVKPKSNRFAIKAKKIKFRA